jgi:pyruvate/2-oxoglutarate/acetoin dehydrogenase E1 component
LKVVVPSTPYEAKGLLAASIRDPDPVIFLEPKLIYRAFREAIVETFEKTGRAVVVHEAPKTGGLAGEITAILQEEALLYQEAPIGRVTGFDVPYPLYALEDYYLPSAARIEDGILEAVEF